MEERLKLKTKIGYSFGHVFNDLVSAMWFSYFLVYLQFVVRLPIEISGLVVFIGQLGDAIVTPLVGIASDHMNHLRFVKYGRRKTTHLIGTILVVLSYPFIFTGCFGCPPSLATPSDVLLVIVPIVLLSMIGWAAIEVAHLSLIPELGIVQADRDDLSVYRYGSTIISDIVMYGVAWLIFMLPSKIPSFSNEAFSEFDSWRFQALAYAVTSIGVVATFLFHVFTPEAEYPIYFEVEKTTETELSASNSENDISDAGWTSWVKDKSFYMVASAFVLSRVFTILSSTCIPLFLEEGTTVPQQMLAVIPMIMEVSKLIAAIFLKFCLIWFNKKLAFFVGSMLGFGGCVWLNFETEGLNNGPPLYIIPVLIGFCSSFLMILSVSFVSDLISSDKSSSAFIFGFMSFIAKSIAGVSIFVIQYSRSVCEDCPQFYKNIISHGLGSVVMLALAAVLTLNVKKLGVPREAIPSTRRPVQRKTSMSKKSSYGAVKRGFPLIKRLDVHT